jgi:hypothetical protein
MPINDARIALNKEELSEFVMELPRDQENVKRYWFTKEHNLVLQIMHKPVSNESEVMQEVISQISLVPRKLEEGKCNQTVRPYIVDLRKKKYR